MNHFPSDAFTQATVIGSYVDLNDERWYRIANAHLMPEFFMSPVSASDHWLFLSSKGALSAGRGCADHALFPYLSSDKLSDTVASHGPKTILRVSREGLPTVIWEPFAASGRLGATQVGSPSRVNLYKNDLGTKVLFEEINGELGLSFRYSWSFGSQFGFVRNCTLTSLDQSSLNVEVLDGLENLLPYGLNQEFQLRYSNLGDAYKASELLQETGLAIFSLSSIPTDRAEPSESLRATVAWNTGLDQPAVLLCSEQVELFRSTGRVQPESRVRGRRGAYFAASRFAFGPHCPPVASWKIVADVDCDHGKIIELNERIQDSNDIAAEVDRDVAANHTRLVSMIASSDAIQLGDKPLRTQRHQSNVLFNVMRGGLSTSGYQICLVDFCDHVQRANRKLFEQYADRLKGLPSGIDRAGLLKEIDGWGTPTLKRIALEYLPLTFSRRHGDPTRPWNSFSINFLNEDGAESPCYEGNWRDIFQNWEALAYSFPQFTLGMIFRFVCASTADGYNPYRITKGGFEWEKIEANDPWANIGYWGDHQIVYLLKLLETSKRFNPDELDGVLGQRVCSFAQVPYRICDYAQLMRDPQKTIEFDHELDAQIEQRVQAIGADGRLLPGKDGAVYQVTMLEKLLLTALVKLTNFVPDGGVWMNTQRPEWNDANNALVGRGLSVVTTAYLRRYLSFLRDWFAGLDANKTVGLSSEVAAMLFEMTTLLKSHSRSTTNNWPQFRRTLMNGLSKIGSDYRCQFYQSGFAGDTTEVSIHDCLVWLDDSLVLIDETLCANRRADGMYHAYNLLSMSDDAVEIERLPEMLEGQVAILSSGMLEPSEALDVLDSLRESKLYRADQDSYLLYPNRELASFMEKNNVPASEVEQSQLLQRLVDDKKNAIVRRSKLGQYHFNAEFRNADNLRCFLDRLQVDSHYAEMVKTEREFIESLYEQTFAHRNFTGRSGTFFAYEGLGSIYWHMVSKLALAAIENCVWAADRLNEVGSADVSGCENVARLHAHYQRMREGVGVNKSPDHYGAFPTDPYSHTPENAGVKQPGMTGQVKEDILSRVLELGVRIKDGQVSFDPRFFEAEELLSESAQFRYVSLSQTQEQVQMEAGSFAFTLCQVPVVYRSAPQGGVLVLRNDGTTECHESLTLPRETSKDLFARNDAVKRIEVSLPSA